jgi:uncharacterized protein YdeI (YjbR/CyaY-like superfamily)
MGRSELVDAYIVEAAPFARPILRHLRKLIHQGCPEVDESIKWNHASFSYRGKLFAGLGAFKAHATCGFWHQDMEKILQQAGLRTSDAAGLLGRLTKVEDLPDDRTMLRFIKAAVALQDSGKPSRAAPKPKPTLTLPPSLAEALRRNTRAAAHWEKFSPGARRDYIEWIIDAKRDETREQRLLTAIEWIGEGKRRNWKYEKR